ncbi:hypothetical protein [Mycolicibacterium porcinum]|uniref:hypothetical protein n=1 Tax=Mycolicibacterium porcinum TaxID=39693 RepID=UPI003D9B864F
MILDIGSEESIVPNLRRSPGRLSGGSGPLGASALSRLSLPVSSAQISELRCDERGWNNVVTTDGRRQIKIVSIIEECTRE